MAIRDWPVAERPRERLAQQGASALSDAELLARLKAEPDISAASTYPDRATAERVVARVLSARKADVTKWENRTGSRPNLALRLDFGEVIGR